MLSPEELGSLREQIAANQQIIDDLNKHLARKTDEVRIIQQVSFHIASSLDLQKILESILRALDQVLGFRHSMLLLLDPDGAKLRVAASRGYDVDGVGAEVAVGTGVIGVVAKKKKMMRVGSMASSLAYTSVVRANMQAAGRTEGLQDVVTLPGLKGVQSQIAFPLLIQDRLIGVFAVESLQTMAFDELDEVLLSILSHQAASAIENARLYQAEEERVKQLAEARAALEKLNASLEEKVRVRTADVEQAHDEAQSALRSAEKEKHRSQELLGRMAPPEVVPLMLEDKLQARKLNASIVFTDLEGFTQFSSGVEPDELFAKLNDFFSRAGSQIQKYRGYVNKTNGDSIMALFGVPFESPTHAVDAVLASLDMQKAVSAHFGLRMRIGINSGPITAGILGPRDKSLYDVLGDAVNLASRMEKVCPAGSVTVSEQTCALIAPYFNIRPLGKQMVKGKGKLPCFEVLGIRGLHDDPRRLDPTSRLAREHGGLWNEVAAFKAAQLASVDFPSIQARDGALAHNECVAVFSLALHRALKASSGALATQAKALPEKEVLALALLHDIGKFALKPALLNDPELSLPALEDLRVQLCQHSGEALGRLGYPGLAQPLQELYDIDRTKGECPAAALLPRIVSAADIYDALAAPKICLGKGWTITGSLEELLRLAVPAAVKPVYRALAELLRPEKAGIQDSEEDQVLYR